MKRLPLLVLCLMALAMQSFAADRDMTARDLQGVPKHHHYLMAVAGGTALGAGIGILLPGGAKTAFKGALIGGGATSAFYMMRHRNAARGWTQWAHIGTNAILGTGLGWLVCNCRGGAAAGALIGGGGTAALQAYPARNHPTLDAIAGAGQP